MKKLLTIFFLVISFCAVLFCGLFIFKNSDQNSNNNYLRIHIRANSNLECDQDIKYIIKDAIVEFLTPAISRCKTKEDFEKTLKDNLLNIECIANEILAQNSFDYKTSAQINNEYFPVRSYDNLTLQNGYYDALIINLGSGKGDNWWCVVYPPLCFLNSNADYCYKSRIVEFIKKYFGG